jgi:hypothetical protein
MIKVYPVLLVPLVLRYLGLRSRRAAGWAAVFGLTVGLLALPPLLREGWASVWGPYHVQLARKLEPLELTFYDYILPASLADNNSVGRAFRLGALLLTLVALVWRRPPDLASLLRRCALLLIVFVSLAVFYSPQWLLWLAPFLLPLARRHIALACLLVGLDLVSYLGLTRPLEPVGALVYARFVVLAAIVALLLRAEWTRPRKERPCAELPPNAGCSVSP